MATDDTPTLLFKHKEGTVTVTIYGPPIGFRWTRVEYFRWVQNTKEPDGYTLDDLDTRRAF